MIATREEQALRRVVGALSPRNRLEARKATRLQTTAVTISRFTDFVDRVKPNYQWYPHVRQLAAVLQKVANGEISRLMVFMPPRHGKSEMVSRLFAAYYLHCHPERWVGITSYEAGLAYGFSRNARDNYQRVGGKLSDTAAAVKLWETDKGGGLWAAGVGGPITGKGFHLGIIDDPIKNAEEAASETIRAKQKDWLDSTFSTREEPGAAVIVIQTRWHEDDLSGYILEKELEEPEHWHIVHFEAIKEEDVPDYPETCTLEPDPREPGEPLAPLRYSLEKLKKVARRIGSYFFGALYQQRPSPREGGMFKRAWFEIVHAVPYGATYVRYWDKAGTKDAGAHTAGVLMAEKDKVYYVVDMVMGQWSTGKREEMISLTAESDRAKYGRVETWIEQEPGSGGKESAESTVKNNPEHGIRAERPSGDKVLRSEPMAAQAEINNVKLLRADWNNRYLDIITAFPTGKVKDPADASSGAFNKLANASSGFQTSQYA